jgi:hypothetical protein
MVWVSLLMLPAVIDPVTDAVCTTVLAESTSENASWQVFADAELFLTHVSIFMEADDVDTDGYEMNWPPGWVKLLAQSWTGSGM